MDHLVKLFPYIAGIIVAVQALIVSVLAWYLKKQAADRKNNQTGNKTTIEGLSELIETYKSDRLFAEKKASSEERKRKDAESEIVQIRNQHMLEKSEWMVEMGALKNQQEIFKGDLHFTKKQLDVLTANYQELKKDHDEKDKVIASKDKEITDLHKQIEKLEADWAKDRVRLYDLQRLQGS